MKYLLAILMFVAGGLQAQSYTFTIDTNTCRISATGGGLLSYQFQADRIRYVDRHQNILVFDDRTTLALSDGLLANYPTTDSLKGQLDLWFLDCQGISDPVVPSGATALLSNTRSITLDGSTEYVTVPDDNSLTFLNNDAFTWSFWVYAQEATDVYLATKTPSPTVAEYYIGTDASDNPYITLYDSLTTNFIGATSSSTLPENQWVHLAVSHTGSADSTDIVWYMDGVPTGQTAFSRNSYSAMHNLNAPLNLGTLAGVLFSEVELDNIAVWDDVLTLQEVKELSAIRDYNYHTDVDSLISWWGFDSPDSVQAGGIDDLKGTNDGSTVNMTVADNFTPCVAWPYDYQLDTTDTYADLTPMQSAADTAYGGFSFNMDGINERITVADNNLLSFGDGATDSPFSISMWVDMDDVAGFGMFWKQNEYQLDGTQFFLYDNVQTAYIGTSITAGVAQYQGQRAHYMRTYDGSGVVTGLKTYINGVVQSTTNFTVAYTAMHNTGSIVNLGFAGGAFYADGQISDIILFDKELSQAETDLVYNGHAPRNENAYSLAGNIVGYWNAYNASVGIGNVLDQSGNSLDGTMSAMTADDLQYDYPRTFYDYDNATSWGFDGSTELISVDDSDSLSFGDGVTDQPFAISAWINPSTLVGSAPIVSKGAINVDWEYMLRVDATGSVSFFVADESVNSCYLARSSSAGDVTTTGWYHVVASYDALTGTNADLDIYVNGVKVDANNISGNEGSYVAMENLGNTLDIDFYNSDYLAGQISNFTLLTTAVDNCQAQEIYNDGSPVLPSKWTFYETDFIHYRLNELDDPTLTYGVVNIFNTGPNGTPINTPQKDNTKHPMN